MDAFDLVLDRGRRSRVLHASVEGSAIVAAAGGVVPGARRLRAAPNEAQDLRELLAPRSTIAGAEEASPGTFGRRT